MYTELFKILNEGTKKSVPEIIMTKLGYQLFDKYRMEEISMQCLQQQLELFREEYQIWRAVDMERKYLLHNPNPDDIYGARWCQSSNPHLPLQLKKPQLEVSRKDFEKLEKFEFLGTKYSKDFDSFLMRYYNVEPFHPWVMLNISPKWKKPATTAMAESLRNIFKEYMKEEWYSEWYYVIESGGDGDHPHLHAVCKFNPNKNTKSCYSHVSKNWRRQVMKYAKSEGLEGVVLKPGLQNILIHGESGEEILKDKLNYLVESEKPPGHKNKTLKALPMYNCRIKGGL